MCSHEAAREHARIICVWTSEWLAKLPVALRTRRTGMTASMATTGLHDGLRPKHQNHKKVLADGIAGIVERRRKVTGAAQQPSRAKMNAN